jgi:hypothetical protein
MFPGYGLCGEETSTVLTATVTWVLFCSVLIPGLFEGFPDFLGLL